MADAYAWHAIPDPQLEVGEVGTVLVASRAPDFAAFAELCGGRGFAASQPDEPESALRSGLEGGPSIVAVTTSGRWV